MSDRILMGLYIVSAFCLWILLAAIVLNFYFSKKSNVKKEKKSIVETGSMLMFFLVMVLLVLTDLGYFQIDGWMLYGLAIPGALFILLGTVVNMAGRYELKGNWGNQIRIYKDHSLITTGIYRYIRHPLYSSTIMMLIGFAFLFQNVLVLVLVCFVFIPFMVYRARQEETELKAVFGEAFIQYQARTGMLIPRILKQKAGR
jgi:protein-S-isoprenylcysteine O-methyltransferase Ste14